MLAGVIALVAASSARAESLAGQTTIASARPGVVVVHLDKPLHFDESSLPSATFSGAGEWRGVALIGTEGMLAATSMDGATFLGTSSDLPAGDYRFYVATDDGVPVRATLTLPGLDGSAGFAPSAAVPLHRAAPSPHASASNRDTTVIGTFANTPSGSMGFDRLAIDYAAPSAGRSEHCLYFEARRATAPDAFDVGCPGGFDADAFSAGYGEPFVAVTQSPGEPGLTSWFAQSGGFGEGANVTAEGGAPTFNQSARWIDFGDEGEPIASAPAAPALAPDAPAPPAATPAAPAVHCPSAARRLPHAFRARAARAALAGRRGLKAVARRPAGADARRIVATCGRAALQRTAVVRMRGTGLTETAYVVRTRRGWRVWWSDRRQVLPTR